MAGMPGEHAPRAPAGADAAPRVPPRPPSSRRPAEPRAGSAAPAEEPSAPRARRPAAASTPAQPKAEPQTAAPASPSAPVTAAPDVQTPAAPLTGQTAPQRTCRCTVRPPPSRRCCTWLSSAASRAPRWPSSPAELGGIEIRLQSTAAGITAQVVADSPEAARLLAQAGDDLRRALEARDVNLVSLEVSTSSDQQRESARGEWSDGDDADRFGSSARSTGDADGDAEPTPTTHSVIELPGGLLVDVLA